MKPTKAPFVQQVKDALSHLHDHAYLQLHPLATTLAVDHKRSLRDLLCAEIEQLQPPARLPRSDTAWRPYLSLHLRYVEGMEIADVAEALALSPRQCRREHQKGLHALSDRLYQQLTHPLPLEATSAHATMPHSETIDAETTDAATTSTDLDCGALETEVERLGAAGTDIGETVVGHVLPGVLDTLADFAAQRHVHVHTTLAPDLPPVHVERVVLRQVLLNTLAHLLDGCEGGEVAISATRREGAVVVQMGCESPNPIQRKQEDERLTVVAQLLRMRRGMLTQPDGMVTLRLPARQPSTVLVVDDNPDVIRLFRRYLSGTTHEVLGATTSDEALQLAQHVQPAAIILDVMMPDRDGWEILQYLQHQPSTQAIPVIVCSVLQEQVLPRSLGAVHFLAKPVTRQALLTALSTVLESPKQLQW